jgi:hypothetical protein
VAQHLIPLICAAIYGQADKFVLAMRPRLQKKYEVPMRDCVTSLIFGSPAKIIEEKQGTELKDNMRL